ncbi:ABC transporter transmembrane domain-containing protein [Pseudoalteromonas sp. B62]
MKIIREGIVYSKLKSLCKQQRWILFSLVALNILVISSSFGIAYTVELLFKEQVTIKRLNYFVVIIWSLLLTFVLSNAIKQKLVFDLKEMLGNQLLSFAISRLLLKQQELFDKTSPTKLYSKVDYDIKAINVCLHFVLSILLQSSGILLFGFAYLLTTSIYMTILSVIIIPIIILIIFKISQNVAGANAKKEKLHRL